MQKQTLIRSLAAVGSAAVLATALTGCSVGRTDVAAMVYQVSVSPATALSDTDVSYAHTPDPEADIAPVMQPVQRATANGVTDPEIWSEVGSIVGEQTATVTATPPAGATATCVILRDGQEELATKTGKPGEPVTCEVQTPERKPGVLTDLGLA